MPTGLALDHKAPVISIIQKMRKLVPDTKEEGRYGPKHGCHYLPYPRVEPWKVLEGRVVFGGHDIKDQNLQAAIFQLMSSSPPSMEAARAGDLHGLMDDYDIQIADAKQAYLQTPWPLKEGIVATWVCSQDMAQHHGS